MKNTIKVSLIVGTLFSVALAFGFLSFTPSITNALGYDGCCTGSDPYPTGGGGGSSYTPPVTPNPTCDIKLSDNKIEYGGNVTIKWKTTNAKDVDLSGFGDVPKNNGGFNHTRTDRNLTKDKTYTLTVKGNNGKTIKCSEKVNVKPKPEPKPTCTISANPSQINKGGSSTLSWSSSNATSATINQGVGSVNVNGSKGVTPQSTTTYTMTVTGPGGTANCSTTVTVKKITPNAPSCTITANPTQIQQGGASTLVWSSSNATSATINQGIGSVALNGSQGVTPTVTKTYKMTVTGPGGTADCQTTVVVTTITPGAPYCTITASPTVIENGDDSTLTWSSTNATSATINQGIGSVSLSGTKDVSPSSTRTYTMTVTGPGGSANCSTTVIVTEEPNEPEAPSCDIWASPSSIQQGGSSYITWESDNATSASLSSFGSVGLNGSRTVYPYSTTKYTLTVYNSQGQSAQCHTTVNVGTVYGNPPSCWITLTPQYGYGYNQGLLSWGSYNATSAYITPNIGSIGTQGSQTVYTDGYTQYTLTVYNAQGQSATCRTVSTYVPPPTYYPPQVTLTQIPYTGVVGSTLYWLSILAFALSLAYLAVYYLPMFAGLKKRVPEPVMEGPMNVVKSVAAAMPAMRKENRSSNSPTKDAMSVVASVNGSAPRIVIARS